jgi:hypothetical protein
MTNEAVLLQILFGLIDRAGNISALISKARAQGRTISDAEIDAQIAVDDAAKAALQVAIDEARKPVP